MQAQALSYPLVLCSGGLSSRAPLLASSSCGAYRLLPFCLALLVQQVTVPRRGPGELGAAVWAGCLGCLARLLSLMPEEVAEGRELPSVAPVLPALGLGPALDHPDTGALAVVVVLWCTAVLHHRVHWVGHHCWVVGYGPSVQISKRSFRIRRFCACLGCTHP